MADTLQHVEAGPRSLSHYESAVGKTTVVQLEELARPLRGARIAHVNGTSYGGGVSELLRSLIPLYRSLGIEADWLVIPGAAEFFEVTKAIHNGLQGADVTLTTEAMDAYLDHNRAIAAAMERDYDIIVVHDPQPLPILALGGRGNAQWVWRCHIDSSSPNESVIEFLLPFISEYDALVFTMEEFVPAELRSHRHVTMLPAIDPLSPKNISLPLDTCREIVEWSGVDMTSPLITQVSRFDPWKDPLGVIEAYRLVKQDMPGTQLALLGQMALDDPEGWEMYRRVQEEVEGDPKIFVLTNFNGIGNMEVNAFQASSDVVLQKSLREGFGLVVAEALWKGTPVVAGRAGGIPTQMPIGIGGFLVDSVDECAQKTLHLLQHPVEAREMADMGKSHIRNEFLITRLLADELRLFGSLPRGATTHADIPA